MISFLQWLARRVLTAFSRGKIKKSKKRFRPHFYHAKAGRTTSSLAPLWRNMPIFAFKKHFARKNTRKNDRNFIRKNTGSWTRPGITSPRGHFIEIPSNKGLTPETLPPAGQVQVRCRSGAGQVQVRSGQVQVRSGQVQVRCRSGQVRCRSGARSGARSGQVRCQVRSGQVRSGQVRCIASQVRSGALRVRCIGM